MSKPIHIDENRYNLSVRQAISDAYVECSKRHQAKVDECIALSQKLLEPNLADKMPYNEYTCLMRDAEFCRVQSEQLKLEMSVWDKAREICLQVADDMLEGGAKS